MDTSERFMKGVNLFQGMINYFGIIYPNCSNWLIIEHATGHGACAVTSLGNT